MSPTSSAVRGVAVTHAASAPPFARALAQQLSLHALTDTGRQRLSAFDGVIGVHSSRDPQKATIRGDGSGIEVTHGVADDIDLEVTVDPERRDTVLDHQWGRQSGPTLEEVTAMLNPVLPHWVELAPAFWDAARSVPGIPSIRLVESPGSADRELTLGSGGRVYEIWGSARSLARLLAGLDFFADVVFAGDLRIRGTFSDFSVVSGASMKVMWHV